MYNELIKDETFCKIIRIITSGDFENVWKKVMKMKKQVYKTLTVLVAFLTFGIITPNHEIWTALEVENQQKQSIVYNNATDIADLYQLDDLLIEENPIDRLVEKAKAQSYIKFGEKITPVIGDEFEEIIFPKITQAIEMTVERLGKDSLKNLAITEAPSGDYKEKMFNVYNAKNGQDQIRFHVRTENRPFEGHYYNFHYHTLDDKFVTHYDLGEIFWSKDTPPKWLS